MPHFKVTRTAKGHRQITEAVQRPRRDREIIEKAERAGLDPTDSIVRWLQARCTLADASAVPAQELYGDFKQWVASNGIDSASRTSFGRKLARVGFSRDKQGQGSTIRWLGLRLQRVTPRDLAGSEGSEG